MTGQWQQPVRTLEVQPNKAGPGTWYPVLFVRVLTRYETVRPFEPSRETCTWEVLTHGGHTYSAANAMIRHADGGAQ